MVRFHILSKVWIFKAFSQSASHFDSNYVNHRSSLLVKCFCSVNESPELPDWVKFPENGDNCHVDTKEDFVLPKKLSDQFCSWGAHNPGSNDRFALIEIVDRDVDSVSRLLTKKFQSPRWVFRALDGCDVSVSKCLVDRILKRFGNDWVQAFGFFEWVSLRSGYKHMADSYDAMVDILGKSRQFDLMWVLVEEMNRLGGLISLVTVSKIMRRLAGAGRWMDAIEVFHAIECFGLRKDTEAMNILLDTLCKERGVEIANDVFLELRSRVCPDASSFNIMIHGWCKARRLVEAWGTMEKMREFGFQPCVVSYTSLVQAHCLDRNFFEVYAILDEMERSGCPPNVVTYTIVIHSLGKAKETQEAIEAFEKMRRKGCTPDTSVYNSLIYILGSAGRLQDARDLYEEMLRIGISPNTTTYHTLISITCEYSQEETALELLRKMEENSSKPDLETYTPLLKMCCKKKRMKVLHYLLSDMFKKDIGLDFGTYTLLVVGLCRSGELKQSCLFFEEMILKGLFPWKKTYKLLMEGLERKNMGKEREKVQQLMLQAESAKKPGHHFQNIDDFQTQ